MKIILGVVLHVNVEIDPKCWDEIVRRVLKHRVSRISVEGDDELEAEGGVYCRAGCLNIELPILFPTCRINIKRSWMMFTGIRTQSIDTILNLWRGPEKVRRGEEAGKGEVDHLAWNRCSPFKRKYPNLADSGEE